MNGITISVGKNGQVTTKTNTWTRGEQKVIDFTRGVLLTVILMIVMWIGIQLSEVFGWGSFGILGTFLVLRSWKVGSRITRGIWNLFRSKPEVKKPVVQNQPKPQQQQFNQQPKPQGNGNGQNGQNQNRPQFQGNR